MLHLELHNATVMDCMRVIACLRAACVRVRVPHRQSIKWHRGKEYITQGYVMHLTHVE